MYYALFLVRNGISHTPSHCIKESDFSGLSALPMDGFFTHREERRHTIYSIVQADNSKWILNNSWFKVIGPIPLALAQLNLKY